MTIHRRTLLELAPLSFLPLAAQTGTAPVVIAATFPSQSPELSKEMVGAAHANVKRVKELLKEHPSLSKAAWDWGFGDWETALGSASHTGNREIAALLLENGAAPTIFSATMLGQLDVVKAMIAASPGLQRLTGPHSISLLAHAKAGGEGAKAVYQYLESLGDAGGAVPSPITKEQTAALTGVNSFGSGLNYRVEIVATNGQLQFKRVGGEGRRLFHLGEMAFHPVGASAVRIRFDGTGGLTVYDPRVVLTAQQMVGTSNY